MIWQLSWGWALIRTVGKTIFGHGHSVADQSTPGHLVMGRPQGLTLWIIQMLFLTATQNYPRCRCPTAFLHEQMHTNVWPNTQYSVRKVSPQLLVEKSALGTKRRNFPHTTASRGADFAASDGQHKALLGRWKVPAKKKQHHLVLPEIQPTFLWNSQRHSFLFKHTGYSVLANQK